MLVTVLWNTRHRRRDIVELPVDSEKERRIAEITGHIQKLLAGGGS
jgi:hypothetical protein